MSEYQHTRDLADIPQAERPIPAWAPCPASTTTDVKTTPGLLKGLYIAGTGTAGTVTIKDGTTTLFVAGVPAAVGTWSLPLPPEGALHDESIIVVTSGTGVTAAALFL